MNARQHGLPLLVLLALSVPLAALAAARAARATQDEAAPGAAEAAGAPAAPSPLEELAWMAGRWEGEALGGFVEEHWLAPRAGTMAGVFRLTAEDGLRAVELLLLEAQGEEVHLRFAHFSPGFRMWDGDPVELRLAAVEGERAVFDATDGAPSPGDVRRVVYWRPSPTALHARVEQTPKEGGTPDSLVVELARGR